MLCVVRRLFVFIICSWIWAVTYIWHYSNNVGVYDLAMNGATTSRDDPHSHDWGVGGQFSNTIFQNLWIEHTKVLTITHYILSLYPQVYVSLLMVLIGRILVWLQCPLFKRPRDGMHCPQHDGRWNQLIPWRY